MKQKIKKSITYALIVSFLFIPSIVKANTEKYADGYWYLYDNGKKLTGFQTVSSSKKVCYYDSEGKMQYGEKLIDGYWYYFQPGTGRMTTGFQYLKDGNKTVYYNENGQMQYGYKSINNNNYYFDLSLGSMMTNTLINVNGKNIYFNNEGKEQNVMGQMFINNHWYLFDKDGVIQTGFQYIKDQNKTVYYNEKGQMLYGFQKIGDSYYFFDYNTGARYSGELIINGHWHLFGPDGKMLTGFQYIKNQNKTVYYNEKGQMLYGFQKIGDSYYFFDYNTGKKEYSGEKKIDNHWYLFDKDGVMLTGFQYIKAQNKTVYYNEKGQMLYGFQKIGDSYYFFDYNTGARYSGELIINGHWHLFGPDGKMLTGFQYIKNQNKTVYYNEKGQMLYGFQKIGDSYYFFDYNTGKKEYSGEKKIDNHWYLFDKDGVMLTGFQYIKAQNKTVYYNEKGQMLYGQQNINGFWYNFETNTGKMLTGFQYIKNQNKTVYYNEKGQMLHGYYKLEKDYYYFDISTGEEAKDKVINVDGKFKYFNKSGKEEKVLGQKYINNHWYLFDKDGKMLTGFQNIESQNKTVYYNENGEMQYGENYIDGAWRYFDKSTGAMSTGFTNVGGKIVYYDKDGKMVYGNKTIDGIDYYFNTVTGAMKDNFIKKDGNTYYYSENGKIATGWNNIAGIKYYFNNSGELIGKDVRKVIDVSAHNKKIDWDKVYRTKSVDGVIVRVSASSVYEDKMLSYNISNLKRLGIPYGLYIYSYAENGQEGREYAQFVVNEIKKYSMNPSLGIYLDLESNNITGYLDTNKYNEITRGFMDVMNNNGYGNLSRIYTYKKYANDVLNSDYLKNQIYWIAQYNNRLTYSGNYSAWQYTSSDWIDGISTKVDSSVWFAKF